MGHMGVGFARCKMFIPRHLPFLTHSGGDKRVFVRQTMVRSRSVLNQKTDSYVILL